MTISKCHCSHLEGSESTHCTLIVCKLCGRCNVSSGGLLWWGSEVVHLILLWTRLCRCKLHPEPRCILMRLFPLAWATWEQMFQRIFVQKCLRERKRDEPQWTRATQWEVSNYDDQIKVYQLALILRLFNNAATVAEVNSEIVFIRHMCFHSVLSIWLSY